MKKTMKVLAKDVLIEVGRFRGLEQHGLYYRTKYGSDAVGGQCAVCNTIVWTNARLVSIFNRSVPTNVPKSGAGYTKYANQLDCEFLGALSPCPNCHNEDSFDLVVTNISNVRFADGEHIELDGAYEFVEASNPDEQWVWWTDGI